MPVWLQTAALLCCSNLFMTFAWYGHLKSLNGKPWLIAALISWGIALVHSDWIDCSSAFTILAERKVSSLVVEAPVIVKP